MQKIVKKFINKNGIKYSPWHNINLINKNNIHNTNIHNTKLNNQYYNFVVKYLN